MHVEQTYKGNYHLLANIDGAERKFVIGKNKEDFASIEQIGLANLTTDHLKTLVAKYFNL
jgi:serine/threonine-protein kinase HipA